MSFANEMSAGPSGTAAAKTDFASLSITGESAGAAGATVSKLDDGEIDDV